MVRAVLRTGTHVLLVDTGTLLSGSMQPYQHENAQARRVSISHTGRIPIAFNPFFVEDGVFDIEKESMQDAYPHSCGNMMTSLQHVPRRWHCLTRSISSWRKYVPTGRWSPSFNTFYEFIRDEVSGDTARLKAHSRENFDVFQFP